MRRRPGGRRRRLGKGGRKGRGERGGGGGGGRGEERLGWAMEGVDGEWKAGAGWTPSDGGRWWWAGREMTKMSEGRAASRRVRRGTAVVDVFQQHLSKQRVLASKPRTCAVEVGGWFVSAEVDDNDGSSTTI